MRDLMKEKLQAKSAEEAKEETTVRKTAKTTAPKDKAVTAEPPAKESTADVTKPASKLYVAIHQLKDGHDWHFDSRELPRHTPVMYVGAVYAVVLFCIQAVISVHVAGNV